MKGVIRVGDPTSHGGTVVAGAPAKIVNGIPVARVGDSCTCPKKGHSGCVVAEGDPTVTIDGIPVAFHGHKTTCGASLISTIPTSGKG